jgi:hypothetical protein
VWGRGGEDPTVPLPLFPSAPEGQSGLAVGLLQARWGWSWAKGLDSGRSLDDVMILVPESLSPTHGYPVRLPRPRQVLT